MTYEIVLSRSAKAELHEFLASLALESIEAPKKWVDEFDLVLEHISDNPYGFSLIPEFFAIRKRWRSANVYSHRLIFSVNDEQRIVTILRIYHGARRPLRRSDVDS